MADEIKEVEGVRILGATEAQELKRTPTSTKSSRKARAENVATVSTEQTSDVELPHWSEAPTGEVPAVEAGELGDGWEALTGSQPRIRVDQNDWKEVDYDPSLSLQDDSFKVGALGDDHISLEDNDEEFIRDVEQKRAAGANPSPTMPSNTVVPVAGEDAPKITKISTVPDSVTAPDVEVPAAKSSRAKTSAKAPRDKRAESDAGQGEAKENEAQTLMTRTMTGGAMGAVAIVCFFLGTTPSLVLAALVISAMSIELCNALRQIGSKPATLLVGAMSFFSVIAGYLVGDRSIALSAVTFFVFSALWYLFGVVKARPIVGMAVSALVFVYVGILGSFAGMILALKNSSGSSIGVFVLVSAVLCVAANDTAAYLFGKFMGRTPLAPSISPNKTMEGTTAGFIASIIVGIFVAYSSTGNIWNDVKGGIFLGVLMAAASLFGDLVESMLKRDCKLKDFGTILPGHGGLMDRFDGLLFALPVVFYLALALI